MTTDQRYRRVYKPLVWLGSLLPLALLLARGFGVAGGSLGADPAEELLRTLGKTALNLLWLTLAVTHARERIQFGRPLAKFQAVQHLVADIAAEAALARAATDGALANALRTDWTSEPSLSSSRAEPILSSSRAEPILSSSRAEHLDFLVAVARSCVGHAASVVVRNAHQVHGAIGTTREHRLHEFTTRALAWRSEYGSVQSWDEALTDHAIAAGADGLWALITTTSNPTDSRS